MRRATRAMRHALELTRLFSIAVMDGKHSLTVYIEGDIGLVDTSTYESGRLCDVRCYERVSCLFLCRSSQGGETTQCDVRIGDAG